MIRTLLALRTAGFLATIAAVANPALAQTTSRVSVITGGTQAEGGDGSFETAISADGRYVAFSSTQVDLVAGDTNENMDVFVHDRQTGQTTRVSVATGGGQGVDGDALAPVISADGRYVAFYSDQANLVVGDTNGTSDIFVHDRLTSTTTRVSVASNGAQGIGPFGGFGAADPVISADGRYVVFDSDAANLVAGDTNGAGDVFLHDRQTGTTTRLSTGLAGAQANNDSFTAAMSPDGRFVAYASLASNLVPGDTNNTLDVFLLDRTTGQTQRVSVTAAGAQTDGPCFTPSISGDGQRVAFACLATNVVPNDINLRPDVFVRDRQAGTTVRVTVGAFGPLQGGLTSLQWPVISDDGRFVLYQSDAINLVSGDTNNVSDIFLRDLLANDTVRIGIGLGGVQGQGGAEGSIWPSLSSGGRFIAFTSDHSNLVPADTNDVADTFVYQNPALDRDADGLPDAWETLYGLNPGLSGGADGADGDPDGDGKTNAQEFAAGTHPRGFETRYLAEGATGSLFDVAVALLNPGTRAASVLLRLQKADATTVSQQLTVPAGTRRTVVPKTLKGLEDTSFSTVVESDALIVVDRTMTWGGGYGSHAEKAVVSPSLTWYLAEGATLGAFQLFYLLQNPNTTSTSVKVRYLLPVGAPVERTYPLPPSSRTTIYVDLIRELASTDVSAVFEATQPIIVERAMYLDRPGELFSAGHASAGVTAPATSWFLAEGATGRFFDLYVLLANPTGQPATVQVRYLTDTGAVYEKPYTLAPNSRTTIWVDLEEFPGLGTALQEAAVSTTVTSTNGVPIIVERAMWWPDGGWYEAHNSPGSTTTGTRWALAEGEVGGPTALETYVLIANTSSTSGSAKVTLHFEDGTTAEKTVPLLPNSRTNVAVGTDFPVAANRKFGVVIESLGPAPAEIVVERAMYLNANGVFWAAGTNALATKLQ